VSDNKPVYLYVFAKIEDGEPVAPIKIGISKSVWTRLSTLQTACPFKVTCFHYFGPFTAIDARWHERGLHEAYASQKSYGEWFDVEPQEVYDLAKHAFADWGISEALRA
jgi:hypothetical protein